MIIKTPVTTNYFSAPNHVAQDRTLSDRAARILVYAASLPKDWRIIPAQLMKYFGWGRDSTYKALHELCVKGYAVLTRGKQWAEWIIYTTPQTPESLKATPDAAPKNPGFKNPCQTDALQKTEGLQTTEVTTTPAMLVESSVDQKHDVVVCGGITSDTPVEPVETDKTSDSGSNPATPTTIHVDLKSRSDQDPVPHIPDAQQGVARKALQPLTAADAANVLVALSLAMAKGTVSNPTGYLISLVKAMKSGSFSPVEARSGAPAITAAERIAKEQQRQAEQQQRGKLTNQQYFEWLNREYGSKAPAATTTPCNRPRLKLAVNLGL